MSLKLRRFVHDPRLWEGIALVCILLIAAYLRMGRSGIVEFKRDEANLSILALDFVTGGNPPLLGIGSSVGIPNAPMNVYVLAIPYAIFGNEPRIATQFIGFLNVIAVGLTYLIGRRYGGPYTGLLAALVYATSPWAVIFSRKIWAQNMLPPFALLALYTGLRGFVDKKRWAQVAHLPLLAFTGQIHYVAFVIVPVTLYLIWSSRRELTRQFYIGVALALIISMPYAVGMIRAGYDHPQAFVDALARSDESASDNQTTLLTTEAIEGTRIIVSGVDVHSLAGPQRFQDFLDTIPYVYDVFDLFWLIIIAFFLLAGIRITRSCGANRVLGISFLLWIIFPIVIFTIGWTKFFIHYLVMTTPIIFIITTKEVTKINKNIKIILTTGIICITLINIQTHEKLLTFLNRNYTQDGFGTPIKYLYEVRNELVATPRNIIGQLEGQTIGIDDEPTIWYAMIYKEREIQFENETTRIYSEEGKTILRRECDNTINEINLRQEEGCYTVETRQEEEIPENTINIQLTNGTRIVGYTTDVEATCIDIFWIVEAETSIDYSFAVKFITQQQTYSADGPALPGRYWQIGDTIRQTFCNREEIQGRVTKIKIGMYTYDRQNFYNENIVNNEQITEETQITIAIN